ncbi:hypothetical protein GCM10009122_31480 [Fulvivirga kasyanovii]|uniref:Uncharacterized protein n=1 Tax=Fulvivirga kasyanovii TaxID=396812 RepID=A0ABW9RX69_9BACT|nr:hypothetical protein [Fulvivirga kasyanovii]MTI27874.1 hypothetical protein [Fulvivirga kasyanovii]
MSVNTSETLAFDSIEELRTKLAKINDQEKKARLTRFIVSALSNIPWIGGFIGAGSAFHAEREQGRINDLQRLWMEEHQRKIEELAHVIFRILDKIESAGAEAQERIASEEYQSLVRKGFREWNDAETTEKKECIRRLLTNASTSTMSTDDMVRLFIDWIKTYHETHFMVIREVYKHQSITRKQIWSNISSIEPAEDSIEADLYKLLIRDLSTGGIIRQIKKSTYLEGERPATKPPKNGKYKSAFDDVEQYELTELGRCFVHYTMEEVEQIR